MTRLNAQCLAGFRVCADVHTMAATFAARLLADLGAEVHVHQEGQHPSGCLVTDDVRFRILDMPASVAGGLAAAAFDVLLSDSACCPHHRLRNGRVGEAMHGTPPTKITISPFDSGRSGSPFTASSVAGAACAIGEPHGEPLGLPHGVVESITAVNAIAAFLASLFEDGNFSGPRNVDIAISMGSTLEYFVGMNNTMFDGYPREWLREGRRSAGFSGPYPLSMFDASDGPVGLIGRSNEDWARILSAMGNPKWADKEGYRDAWFVGENVADEVDKHVSAWVASHSIAEMKALATEFDFVLAPVNSVSQMLAERHLEAREFWVRDSNGTVVRPRLPFFIREYSGEDSAGQMAEACRSSAGKRRRHRQVADPSRLLHGIRVLDFTWVWAGPLTTAILASLGAEVIKVEHPARPDGARMRGRPSRNGVPVSGPALEVTPYFHQNGVGKLSLGASMKSPGAISELCRLAKDVDVVVENMRPGVLARNGLGFEQLSHINPQLVMLSMSVAGQSGDLSGTRGYAPVMSGLAGLESLIGYGPGVVTGSYTFGVADPIAGVYGALAVLAGLADRQLSGRGSWIDLAQLEAAISCLSVPIAGQLSGVDQAPTGNREPGRRLQRAFRCGDGPDSWFALTVTTEAELDLLRGVVGTSGLERSRTHESSRSVSILESRLESWAHKRTRCEAVRELVDEGLCAAPVLRWEERDEREAVSGDSAVQQIFHPFGGWERLHVPPWRFDGARPGFTRRAPLLGEHTVRLLGPVTEPHVLDTLLATGALYAQDGRVSWDGHAASANSSN